MVADDVQASRHSQHVRPNTKRPQIRTKVWLEVDGRFVLGEGGVPLLEAIATERSLTRAAQQVGWSYKHAWSYLRYAERTLEVKLTVTRAGRGTARGMALTDEGRALMCRLRAAGDEARQEATRVWKRETAVMSPPRTGPRDPV